MRFVIVGPGSLGCSLASLLAGAGDDVQLVHRDRARAGAMAADGITVLHGQRREHLRLPVVPAAEAWADASLTIIATKANDVAAAVRDLRATTVLAIQNGLDSERALLDRFGASNCLIGVVRTAAFREADGAVRLVRVLPTTVGRADGEPVSPAQGEPLAAMDAAGASIEIVEDIRPARWMKLLINAAINPVAAMLDVPNGRLAELPAACELMGELAAEAAAVAAALGIVLPVADPSAFVAGVCRETAGNINSMLADIRAGRATEVDYINGAVCRAAEAAGLSTPFNRTAWQLVKARQAIEK